MLLDPFSEWRRIEERLMHIMLDEGKRAFHSNGAVVELWGVERRHPW